MAPTLQPGAVVWAWRWFWYLAPGTIVIVQHDGIEKIKRIHAIKGDEVSVLGDNPTASTDSRHFGTISRQAVMAKVWRSSRASKKSRNSV